MGFSIAGLFSPMVRALANNPFSRAVESLFAPRHAQAPSARMAQDQLMIREGHPSTYGLDQNGGLISNNAGGLVSNNTASLIEGRYMP